MKLIVDYLLIVVELVVVVEQYYYQLLIEIGLKSKNLLENRKVKEVFNADKQQQ